MGGVGPAARDEFAPDSPLQQSVECETDFLAFDRGSFSKIVGVLSWWMRNRSRAGQPSALSPIVVLTLLHRTTE